MPLVRTYRRLIAAASTALAIVMMPGAIGCAPAMKKSSGWPFASKSKNNEPVGIKTAAKTIEELNAVQAGAKNLSAEEQQRYLQELGQRLGQEQDPLVRMQIIETLAAIPNPQAVAVVQTAMSDPNADVRVVACQALGHRGGPEAVRELTRVLGTETDVDVRIAATRALGETGDESAVSSLGEVLSDSDPALQYRAVQSLKNISGRDFGSDMNAWKAYAKDSKSAPPPSIADRVRGMFR